MLAYTSTGSVDLAPYVLVWFICGMVGAVLGGSRKMGGTVGFFLGLLVGPIGVIIVAVAAKREPHVPVAPVVPSSVADEVAKLSALHDAGVLSDADYAAQKAKLLS